MDIDGLVEVKGIKTFVRLAQFIQKQVFIVLFFSWIDIFPSTGQAIFPSLGFCIVSI